MRENWRKNISLFLFGQALSVTGSMLTGYAILWYIVLQTGSGSAMSVYVVATFLPMFLISPIGGVWADYYNRKHLINLADGSIALVSLITALIIYAGFVNHWILLICAALRAAFQGVHSPAINSFIPLITPKDKLEKINGFNQSIQSFAMIASPMIAGMLLSIYPLEAIFFLDIITAAIGIFIVYFLVKTPPQTNKEKPRFTKIDYFKDLRESAQYIKDHKFIKELIVVSIILFIAFSPSAFLTPLQTARNFGEEYWRLSAIEIAWSAGMLLGGIGVGIYAGFKNRAYTIALSCAFMGCGAILLGVLPAFIPYLAAMFLTGMAFPYYNVPITTLLQKKTDPAQIGRVFGVFNMVATLIFPSGMLIFGPLADIVNIDYLMIASGIAICFLALLFVGDGEIKAAAASEAVERA
ncbi:MAG: MFS transporter [Helicobacteraceae bacterium]|jgi:DHA3 family macrolide efflux protein-like MFS transporter|nr:MFS transporter [Helicobacteraceae bacterium]